MIFTLVVGDVVFCVCVVVDTDRLVVNNCAYVYLNWSILRVLRRGYCAVLKECSDLGFVVN